MSKDKLTHMQQLFVNFYNGNGKESAIKSGASPKTAEQTASRWLSMVKINKAIAERHKRENKDSIADRVTRQEFWTKLMNDPNARDSDRLKASELLGRSEADFTDKREIEVDQRFKEVESQAESIINQLTQND